jgi:hypothetical protein
MQDHSHLSQSIGEFILKLIATIAIGWPVISVLRQDKTLFRSSWNSRVRADQRARGRNDSDTEE